MIGGLHSSCKGERCCGLQAALHRPVSRSPAGAFVDFAAGGVPFYCVSGRELRGTFARQLAGVPDGLLFATESTPGSRPASFAIAATRCVGHMVACAAAHLSAGSRWQSAA